MTTSPEPADKMLHPRLLELLTGQVFTCNELQNRVMRTWPTTNTGVVAAATGSGKTTLAIFLLIDSLLKAAGHNKPSVVLLTTSESEVRRATLQVQPFADALGFGLTSLFTTSNIALYNERASQLRTSADIVVSTPDRFLVHLKVGNIRAQEVVLLITDDVDRMCDAGQCNDLEKICRSFPPNTIKQLFMSNVNKPSVVQRITTRMVRTDDHEVLDFIG